MVGSERAGLVTSRTRPRKPEAFGARGSRGRASVGGHAGWNSQAGDRKGNQVLAGVDPGRAMVADGRADDNDDMHAFSRRMEDTTISTE